MKRILFFIGLCAIFASSCSKLDPIERQKGNLIDYIYPPDPIAGSSLRDPEFNAYLIKHGAPADTSAFAMIIHSAEEFDKMHPSHDKYLKFPDIDFNKHTLIIGRVLEEHPFSLRDQRAVEERDKIKLYMMTMQPMAYFTYWNQHFIYFIFLFPKMNDLPIEVIKSRNYKDRWNNLVD